MGVYFILTPGQVRVVLRGSLREFEVYALAVWSKREDRFCPMSTSEAEVVAGAGGREKEKSPQVSANLPQAARQNVSLHWMRLGGEPCRREQVCRSFERDIIQEGSLLGTGYLHRKKLRYKLRCRFGGDCLQQPHQSPAGGGAVVHTDRDISRYFQWRISNVSIKYHARMSALNIH